MPADAWPADHPLPASALCFTASRSGGPGGQNVNKVNTRATLAVAWADLEASLPAATVRRLRAAASHLCTQQGLQLHSSEHRGLLANKLACQRRLLNLLHDAGRAPRVRRATRPTRGSVRRRLDAKRQRGERKAGRRRVD